MNKKAGSSRLFYSKSNMPGKDFSNVSGKGVQWYQ